MGYEALWFSAWRAVGRLLARFVRPKARFFFSGPTKDTIAPTIQRYESCAWLIQCLGVRVAAWIAKGFVDQMTVLNLRLHPFSGLASNVETLDRSEAGVIPPATDDRLPHR